MFFWNRLSKIGLQKKIFLIIFLTIVPVFVFVHTLQINLIFNSLKNELRQTGSLAGKSLAAEIVVENLLSESSHPVIEQKIYDLLYLYPNIIQADVYFFEDNKWSLIVSNVEEDRSEILGSLKPISNIQIFQTTDKHTIKQWEIFVPITKKAKSNKNKVLGSIRLVVSFQTLNNFVSKFWQFTLIASILTIAILVLSLGLILKKAFENEKIIHEIEVKNIKLSAKNQEMQQKLINAEKYTTLGQLAGSFAHEIGAPLTAITGHVELLTEDISADQNKESMYRRIEIISTQLEKIENIVKGFLKNTSTPTNQKQLVNLNSVLENSIKLVGPRALRENMLISFLSEKKQLNIRAVPVEFEQVFINLLNNSIDSLNKKKQGKRRIEVRTSVKSAKNEKFYEVSIWDNGLGIKKENINEVFRPFFTTKLHGEGTGLGLTICSEILKKYSGKINIFSKYNSWTKVMLNIPEGN